MNVLFTDVATIYNYHRNEETGQESFQRTVLRGVQWRHNKDSFTVSGRIQSAEKVESITIDFDHAHGNKPYLAPEQYASLSDEEREGFWTLSRGKDLFVLGVAEMELVTPAGLKALKESCPYVATVTEISDNRNRPRLKHIKVVGKL